MRDRTRKAVAIGAAVLAIALLAHSAGLAVGWIWLGAVIALVGFIGKVAPRESAGSDPQ